VQDKKSRAFYRQKHAVQFMSTAPLILHAFPFKNKQFTVYKFSIFYKHANPNNQPYYYIITFTILAECVGDFTVLHFLPVFDFIPHFYQLFLVSCLFNSYVPLAGDHVNNASYFPFMSIKKVVCVLREDYYVIICC
jgi:hypothetical protein